MQIEQFNKLLANPVLLNNETVEDLKNMVEEHPSFQVAWLLYLKNLKQIKSPNFNSVLKKVAIRIYDRKLLYKFLNKNFHKIHNDLGVESVVSQNYQLGNKSNVIPGDSLIDKFLLAKPGAIGQNKNENISAEQINDVEKKSTTENGEIITETLASIYFQQKNYKKAEEAYKKLSLKYPEKSVYFATRIEEIEKLKNI
ncbi:MAG: hypothetical protein KAH68_03355 [Draconibacterium sp.]|nr:hypothetical protein [Draconibacterium sp.]